jgi:hypothetical protein
MRVATKAAEEAIARSEVIVTLSESDSMAVSVYGFAQDFLSNKSAPYLFQI